MSSINIPLGAFNRSYTSVSGVPAGTVDNLEVKKGAAGGLEVFAHDTEGNAAQPLEVTPALSTFLEAVGVKADTDFASLDMGSVNASVLREASRPTGIPDLQA